MLVGDNQITPGETATRIRVVFAKAVDAGNDPTPAMMVILLLRVVCLRLLMLPLLLLIR